MVFVDCCSWNLGIFCDGHDVHDSPVGLSCTMQDPTEGGDIAAPPATICRCKVESMEA